MQLKLSVNEKWEIHKHQLWVNSSSKIHTLHMQSSNISTINTFEIIGSVESVIRYIEKFSTDNQCVCYNRFSKGEHWGAVRVGINQTWASVPGNPGRVILWGTRQMGCWKGKDHNLWPYKQLYETSGHPAINEGRYFTMSYSIKFCNCTIGHCPG